jgi:PAS domain S-box-containing protein
MDITDNNFRLVVDNLPMMAWACRRDGTTEFINQQWLNFTGRSFHDSVRLGWRSSIHSEDVNRVDDFWADLLTTGQAGEIEARLQRFDSEYRWFLIRVALLKNEEGLIRGWYGTNIEIEDLKREEYLLAAERRSLEMLAEGKSLATILENICRAIESRSVKTISSILLFDDNDNSLRFAAGNRLSEQWIAFLMTLSIGPASCSCGTAAHLRKQIVVSDIASDPLWSEHRDLAMSNGLRSAWSRPLISDSGKLLGTFCNYYTEPRDSNASDLRLLESAAHLAVAAIEGDLSRALLTNALEDLKRSEVQMRAAIDAIPTQVWWAIPDGSTEFQNRRWLEYAGVTAEEARGWGWQKSVHPDDADLYLKKWQEIQASGGTGEAEARFRRFDGEFRRFLMRVDVLRDEKGNVVKWYGSNTDIEDLRRSEEALRNAQADLTRISRLTTMGEFAASIAHEVNQPLMAIVTNAETCLQWLSHGPPDIGKAQEAAERIVESGQRAADIVRSIRTLSRKSGQDVTQFDINKSIQDVVALIQSELLRQNIALSIGLLPDLPLVIGTQVQFQQVILNLFRNAIESMEATLNVPRILGVTTELVDSRAQVSISDTGTGLDSANRAGIFEAFFTTKPQGMGMGLSICRSIVDAHGGRIWATDNSSRGSAFHFTIPVVGA